MKHLLVLPLCFLAMSGVLAAEKNLLQGYRPFEAKVTGMPDSVEILAKDYYDARRKIEQQYCGGQHNGCVIEGPWAK